jgi:hypothetical protein
MRHVARSLLNIVALFGTTFTAIYILVGVVLAFN